MRKFGQEYRLGGHSHEDISGRLEQFVASLDRAVKYNEHKLRAGPLLNALVLWFLDHEDRERVDVAKRLVERLERFMREDMDSAGGDSAVVAPGPKTPKRRAGKAGFRNIEGSEVAPDGPKSPKRPRKKSG